MNAYSLVYRVLFSKKTLKINFKEMERFLHTIQKTLKINFKEMHIASFTAFIFAS